MHTKKKKTGRGGKGGLGPSLVAIKKFSLQTLYTQPSPELTDHHSHTMILYLLWENVPKEPRVKKKQIY